MTTGKEAFESACQIGVAKSYNYRQLSQVFHGIDVAIQEIEVSGGGNIVVSGTQPDGVDEGQIAFFQGADGNYYEYVWVNGSWVNVKTQNDDVTVAGSAPFITISGTQIETQRDINHYLNERIEGLLLDPSGEPIDLEPFATKEYVDSGDAALGLQLAEISGSVDNVEVAQSALSSQVDGIEVRVASGETIQGELTTRVTETEATQTQLVTRVASGETAQSQIVGRLDLLETTRGADKIYQVLSVTTELAVRNGELVFNNADASLVSFISLAPFDSNGNSSPLVSVGDIIDVEAGGAINRYQVAQGTTDAQSILCIYLSGDSTFAVDQTITIYIYPQNSSNLATTDYVDAQTASLLPKSGGLLNGNVVHGGTANQIMTNNSYIRFGWGDLNTAQEYGGYLYQRDSTTFELGAYSGVTLKFIGEPVFDKSPEVPTPTLDSHAASKYYVDNQIGGFQSSIGDYLPLTGGTLTGNLVLDTGSGLYSKEIIKSTRATGYAFQVRPSDGDETSHIHTNGNVKFADGTFTGNVNLEGNLSFTNGGTINVSNGNAVLSGRASLDIKTAANYPVVISSGSSYKKMLAFYGYDGNAVDNRGEVASVNANGEAYFSKVYSNDEELVSKAYVDQKLAELRTELGL